MASLFPQKVAKDYLPYFRDYKSQLYTLNLKGQEGGARRGCDLQSSVKSYLCKYIVAPWLKPKKGLRLIIECDI